MRAVAVLRPEPGNAATVRRLADVGLVAVRLPLFRVVPLTWTAPDPTGLDALLLTSANGVRHAGAALASLSALPVVAVGAATAEAARAAGLRVMLTGSSDAAAVVERARAAGSARLLHLAGRDRAGDWPGVAVATVYASEPLTPGATDLARLAGSVALLHSVRAAVALRDLVATHDIEPRTIRIGALSDAVAAAAGNGWERVAVADAPSDARLVAIARRLAD